MTERALLWFAQRGWALGGAVAGAAVGIFARPPFVLVNQGWFASIVFGAAAIALLALAFFPWERWVRLVAVTAMVFAAGSRAWGLLFLGDGEPRGRLVGAIAWLLLGYFTWLLGGLTMAAGNQARVRR